MEENRIYAVVAEVISTARGKVTQPSGRQVAQACHAVSKLRHEQHPTNFHVTAVSFGKNQFEPITTIILQARDSAEMSHVYSLLLKKKSAPVIFQDINPEYGLGSFPTAIAVFANKKQISGILDYLPLWGSK